MDEAKVFELPEEWRDDLVRDEAASYIVQLIDTARTDSTIQQKFKRYSVAQDVYDDKQILTKIEFDLDITPYQDPHFKTQVNGAARMVASTFNGSDPYYVFKGGTDSDLRQKRERDTHMILEQDGYKDKIRESARLAAIWTRGTYRITNEYRTRSETWENTDINDKNLDFCGPARETILPQDMVVYPLAQTDMQGFRFVGHRFDRPMYEIWQAQDNGDYIARSQVEFPDPAKTKAPKKATGVTQAKGKKQTVDLLGQHDQPTAALFEEDYSPNLYHLIIKIWPGMNRNLPMKAYRMVIAYDEQQILLISPYDYPIPEYFAPGFMYDPVMFWAENSIATSMFETQTIINDSITARLLSAYAAAKPILFVSGAMLTEQQSFPMSLGQVYNIPGDPKFYSVSGANNPSKDLGILTQEERLSAEKVTGFSSIAQGAVPPPNTTATASAGALQGTSEEGEEKRANFFAEELRMVKFLQIMIRKNFKAIKKFYGDRMQTTSAKDWEPEFEIGVNSQGPNNNPMIVGPKLQTLYQSIRELDIPWAEDIARGASPDEGLAVSKKTFFKLQVNSLDLPFNTEGLVVDTSEQPIAQNNPEPSPFGGQIPGAGGGIPPQLLGPLAQGAQGLSPGMAGGPQTPMPPPSPAPLGIGGGLPHGIPA